jgi:hypothetical protein
MAQGYRPTIEGTLGPKQPDVNSFAQAARAFEPDAYLTEKSMNISRRFSVSTYEA